MLIFLVFSNGWLLNRYAKKWNPLPEITAGKGTFDFGIVPGGFASPDTGTSGYFNSAADRFIQAAKLYRLGTIRHILVCGGNGKQRAKDFSEGAWVKKQLVVFGVPGADIFVEDKSANTADNARYAKIILDSCKAVPPFVLITSARHLRRAALIFKKAGLNVKMYPCNYTAGKGSGDASSFIPQLSTLTGWEDYLKETAAYWWYR